MNYPVKDSRKAAGGQNGEEFNYKASAEMNPMPRSPVIELFPLLLVIHSLSSCGRKDAVHGHLARRIFLSAQAHTEKGISTISRAADVGSGPPLIF